jgi:hypothetical protein
MGTDIHLQIERYDKDTNTWIDINKQALPYRGTLNELWDKSDDKPKRTEQEIQDMIFEYWSNNPESRCYMVFSLLADVRNGYGFAGVETYKPIQPIDNLRGTPSNTSFNEVFDKEEEWCHSFTYYSMKELLEHVSWGEDVHNSGYVLYNDWGEYIESQATDSPMPCPNNYCGDVSGKGIEKYSMDDFENLNNANADKVYIKAKWTEPSPLKQTSFWNWLNSKVMSKLSDKYGVDNIRINMYFDN